MHQKNIVKKIVIIKWIIKKIKKEEESLTKKNPNINIKSRSNKLINQSLSSKNLEQLKNKIISFKSIIINNINNAEKTDKDNNKNDADDKKKESKENNMFENFKWNWLFTTIFKIKLIPLNNK